MSLKVRRLVIEKGDEKGSALTEFLLGKLPKHIVRMAAVQHAPDRVGVVLIYDSSPGPVLVSSVPRNGDVAITDHPLILYWDEDITDTAADLANSSRILAWKDGVPESLSESNFTVSGRTVEIVGLIDTASTYYVVTCMSVGSSTGRQKNPETISFITP